MIWNGIYDSTIRRYAPTSWMNWFAWRPVRIGNHPDRRLNRLVWLVRLQRRRVYDAGGVRIGRSVVVKNGCWEWDYRQPVGLSMTCAKYTTLLA